MIKGIVLNLDKMWIKKNFLSSGDSLSRKGHSNRYKKRFSVVLNKTRGWSSFQKMTILKAPDILRVIAELKAWCMLVVLSI